MNIKLGSTTNTDRISSTDRAVSGNQPDGTGATGANPTGGGGAQAGPPLFADGGTPNVLCKLPPGATSAFTVTVTLAGVTTVHYSLPFTVAPATAATTFTVVTSDAGKTPSNPLVTSWNDLFL